MVAWSPLRGDPAKTRSRLVETARRLFLQYGFRRTSVDVIAAEAEVVKATFYAHYESKEEIFNAVVEALCDELARAAQEALERPGPVRGRLIAGLQAKYSALFCLMHRSPHARELLDSGAKLAGRRIEELDRQFMNLLTTTLEQAQRGKEIRLEAAALNPRTAASYLFRAAFGGDACKTERAQRAFLVQLVDVFLKAARSG
jgi:AcrR family transcriptional regulator